MATFLQAVWQYVLKSQNVLRFGCFIHDKLRRYSVKFSREDGTRFIFWKVYFGLM